MVRITEVVGMIRAELTPAGTIENIRESNKLVVIKPGNERVILTEWPSGPCGDKGWRFTQTGTHASGHPEGTVFPEPVSLTVWKKKRVLALEREKAAVVAATASTGWNYETELDAINEEIEGLKA